MKEEIARGLLESGAISVNLDNPFVFVSGTISPVYVDVRKLLSFPEVREKITEGFLEIAEERMDISKIDIIAGGETAGIPFAALLASKLELPMIYVRKEPKGYGQDKQIEGVAKSDQKVLLVEDVITSGSSKIKFNIGIRAAGAVLTDCMCVFGYESSELDIGEGRKKLEEYGIGLHLLVDWDDVLSIASKGNYFNDKEIKQIRNFLTAPEEWGKKMGYE